MPDHCSGAGYRIAPGLHIVTQYRTELAQSAVNVAVRRLYPDLAGNEAEIGQLGAGPQIYRRTQDGITDVGEMAGLGIIQKYRVLNLGCMPDHATFPDQAVSAQICALPDIGMIADDHRAFYHCP